MFKVIATIVCGLVASGSAQAQSLALPFPALISETGEASSIHTVRLNGADVTYRATVDETVVTGSRGTPAGVMISTAYIRTDIERAAGTPVLFAFGGGPGGSSASWQLRSIGPRIVTASGQIVDNPHSLLDVADLVFVDPVGTGWSTVLPGQPVSAFWSTSADVDSVVQFIAAWRRKNNREPSPTYVVGGSYGSKRAALVAQYGRAIGLAGVVLVANMGMANDPDLPYVMTLPTFAVAAAYHGNADSKGRSPRQIFDEAVRFAQTRYLPALQRGDALTSAERSSLAEELSRRIGLAADFILSHKLRIDQNTFMFALLSNESKRIGLLDTRAKGDLAIFTKRFGPFSDPGYDLRLGTPRGVYAAGFTTETPNLLEAYMRDELHYRSSRPYNTLNLDMLFTFKHEASMDEFAILKAADAIRDQPKVKLLVLGGLYDLTTPLYPALYSVPFGTLERSRSGRGSGKRPRCLRRRGQPRTRHSGDPRLHHRVALSPERGVSMNASLTVRSLFNSAVLACFYASATNAQGLSGLLPGDEPIVVTEHEIVTSRGRLAYEAHVGRLPIRNAETGEVRGRMFFVAYVMKQPNDARPRPLTFAWNGGPTVPAVLVHTELVGPRRIEGDRFVDNAESLLYASDLVFVDPIETGFSRPEKPEYDVEFLSTLGDFAATAEFIRAWRVKFDAEKQPLFLLGESYGTWRVNGTTELLERRGIKIAGAILISGGVPGSLMPFEFQDAYSIPARTAAAYYHKRLPDDLMANREATLKAVDEWIAATYLPALQRLGQLADAERESIADALARFVGISSSMVDRKTLVVSNRAYLEGFLGGDNGKVLNTFDMRRVGPEPEVPGYKAAVMGYLRGELGYRTDMTYAGIEEGYMPTPGPERRSTGSRWSYNHTEITQEMMTRTRAGGGPPASQPWLQNAMRQDPNLRVFVGAGRYDSLNMCEGNLKMSGELEPTLSARFTHRCYDGGHMMYRVQPVRLQLSQELEAFIRGATTSYHIPATRGRR